MSTKHPRHTLFVEFARKFTCNQYGVPRRHGFRVADPFHLDLNMGRGQDYPLIKDIFQSEDLLEELQLLFMSSRINLPHLLVGSDEQHVVSPHPGLPTYLISVLPV